MLWRVKQHCLFDHVYHYNKTTQLITLSFLMIQSVSSTSAAFEAFAKYVYVLQRQLNS